MRFLGQSERYSKLKDRIKISVAGSINRDTVIFPDGRTEHGLGGILYNVIGLSRLLGSEAIIVPICNVGEDIEEDLRTQLRSEGSVDSHSISFVPATNNHCILTYDDDGDRTEKFEGFLPEISLDQMRAALESAVTIVNFISGRDLTLDTLRKFRDICDGTLYIDFHTLSLGLHDDGKRYLRKPEDWREYFAHCDYMQMNRVEFELLSDSNATAENLSVFFSKLNLRNLTAILVTLDANGAYMARRSAGGFDIVHVPVPNGSEVTDATGGGDLFAAGFVSGLVAKRSLDECLRLAVSAGSEGCGYAHPQDIRFTRTSL